MAMTKTQSGLEYEDTQTGSGDTAAAGKTCVMHYTGWLWVDGAKGAKFDSSVDRGRPFSFLLGRGQVIKGWDEGVAKLHVGDHAILVIPGKLAYGPKGVPNVIPPDSTLIFIVEVIEIKQGP